MSPEPTDNLNEYDFRFDAPFAPVVFGRNLKVEGSLIHRQGKPIHGIRAVITHRFVRSITVRARRKRNRPEVAVAYPHFQDALASGFLLELSLGFGRSQLTFQVEDHDHIWRTFYSVSVFVLPFEILRRPAFANTRRFLVLHFTHLAERGRKQRPLELKQSNTVALDTRDESARSGERPYIRLFATSKSNLFIIEIGKLVEAGFRELGYETELLIDEVPEETPPANVLQIVVTPHEFYNLFLRPNFSRPRMRRLTRNVILLCTEQPETGWFHNNLPWTFHARGVADINPLGVYAYRLRGVRCHHLQLGYHDILANPNIPPHADRPIEITFLGSMTPKREAFFATNANFFAEHSCHLRLVPIEFAKTAATQSYLSAQRRNEVLSQSRILLNVHYADQNYFEWHRMLVALANGCCIITETSRGYGTLRPGEHFVMVEPEDLIACCEYYLAHPDECARIAKQGMEFVRDHLQQADRCRAFLEEIAGIEGSASGNGGAYPTMALPVDTPPAPLPKNLIKQLSKNAGRGVRQAIRRDLQQRKVTTPPAPAKPTKTTLTFDPGARRQIIEKRQACHDRWVQQEKMRRNGEPFFALHDNAAVAGCAAPTISVLITLYNYAEFIEECVASVERAALRLQYPCEVLIINDASTDNSLERAVHCQQRLNLPIRIVDKKLNTGLADARNVALELARAPYVFVLDADNLIYPNALLHLHAAITSGDFAAAYSLLCRFQGTPANRIGLLSHFDWDPEVLVQHPYIDAMAMFRRDLLRDGPGYDHQLSQIGWFGWEDYDMWLRFAKNEYRVAFVPNILCLYRYHETSMISSTMLFQTELVQHFVTNYGELLDRFEPRAQLFGIDREELMLETALQNQGGADTKSARLLASQKI